MSKNWIARECGADVVLNPLKENVMNEIKDMTGGNGCVGKLLHL